MQVLSQAWNKIGPRGPRLMYIIFDALAGMDIAVEKPILRFQ
jgi:hypothetical protein